MMLSVQFGQKYSLVSKQSVAGSAVPPKTPVVAGLYKALKEGAQTHATTTLSLTPKDVVVLTSAGNRQALVDLGVNARDIVEKRAGSETIEFLNERDAEEFRAQYACFQKVNLGQSLAASIAGLPDVHRIAV